MKNSPSRYEIWPLQFPPYLIKPVQSTARQTHCWPRLSQSVALAVPVRRYLTRGKNCCTISSWDGEVRICEKSLHTPRSVKEGEEVPQVLEQGLPHSPWTAGVKLSPGQKKEWGEGIFRFVLISHFPILIWIGNQFNFFSRSWVCFTHAVNW